jgi:hypothetical protein
VEQSRLNNAKCGAHVPPLQQSKCTATGLNATSIYAETWAKPTKAPEGYRLPPDPITLTELMLIKESDVNQFI